MSDHIHDHTIMSNPPLTETAIGVRFAPMLGLTAGHFGWFWKSFLDGSWSLTQQAPPLPEQLETFGEEQTWKLMPSMFSFIQTTGVDPGRLQIINADDERVIQIQNNCFFY